MKVRNGFVSNSSSSSFMVSLRKLSVEQLCKITHHPTWGKKMGIEYTSDAWDITVKNGVLYGETSMDNFDMEKFLREIGVTGAVWEQSNHGEYSSEDEVEPCEPSDELCNDCKLRFVCYTNRWRGYDEN